MLDRKTNEVSTTLEFSLTETLSRPTTESTGERIAAVTWEWSLGSFPCEAWLHAR